MLTPAWACAAVVLVLTSAACAYPPTTVTVPGPYVVAGTPTPVDTTEQPAPTPAAAPTVTTWTPPPRSKTSDCISQGGLPDPACTPGAIDPRVTQANIASTICRSGYSKSVRPSSSVTDNIKREQMAAYGLQGVRLADDELDHLLS